LKIGLFFGSFNPVHIGHLVLANYMLEFTELERIWFIISPHNPLKEKKTLLKDNHRLEMVRLAIGEHTKMKASNIEFKLPQPSYTVNTLAHITEKYPTHEFALIMGSDNLASFHKWKNYEYILQHHKIYVYPRPEQDGGALKTHPSVHLTDASLLEISSSFLREAIRNKKDVRYYFADAVWKYLKEMHFYEK
jgi:nicotinate-nucleotide adenylyltransferase